jgi:hypothetical protein
MRDDDLPQGAQGTPWMPGLQSGWPEEGAPPMPPGAVMASGPDTTPTRVLPGGLPSWTPAPAPSPSPFESARAGAVGGRQGLSRRAVLIGAGAGAVGLGAVGAGVGFWLSRRGGAGAIPDITGAGQIFHLLRRAGFGARPGEVGDYIALGVSGSVDQLLDPGVVHDDLDATLGAIKFDFSKAIDLQRWLLLRMIYSRRPLEEKMTLFWHGLLTSSFRKVGSKKNYPLLVQQSTLLRTHALGRFDDLIRAISIDPAMMWWLDLRVSTARAPNENYARELMELFTLGIGNYTQQDVVEGARALTGWTLRGGKAVLVPAHHDANTKTFLGQTGNLGLDEVVKLVCAHPATGRHLAWRLWTFFVHEHPTDADLQPLVDAYHQHDHSIGEVMRALLNAPAFFSSAAYRARVKSPVEFVVGAIRALELPVTGQGLPQLMATMGQDLFDPPNVSGWDGDKVSANWVSTQAWMSRVNFVNALLAAASGGSAHGGSAPPGGDAAVHTKTSDSALQQLIDLRQIASTRALVDYFVAALLDNQLGADRRAVVDGYLAQATAGGGPALTLHGGTKVPAAAVRGVVYLLMSLPEYHLN